LRHLHYLSFSLVMSSKGQPLLSASTIHRTPPQHRRVRESPSSHAVPPHRCAPIHESFPGALPAVPECSSHRSHYTTSPLPSSLAVPPLTPWVQCPAPARAPPWRWPRAASAASGLGLGQPRWATTALWPAKGSRLLAHEKHGHGPDFGPLLFIVLYFPKIVYV
jgi:hypothetical protein